MEKNSNGSENIIELKYIMIMDLRQWIILIFLLREANL